MENNNQYDDLLVRFLVNEVNAEEKVFVESWLNGSEENQRYFESLRKAWQLANVKQTLDYILDEMNVEEKWNHFRRGVTTKEEAQIVPINDQETSESEYGEEEKPTRKPVVYRLLTSLAIAASVLLVIGLGWKLFSNNKVETPVAQHMGEKTDSILFVVRHEVNKTGKEKSIALADGSVIVLANNSEITYREPFTDRRDVTLTGKAYFKVAKDKNKPFRVISGDLSTTALGTEFTVTAFENTNLIIVRLYEGQVVLKPMTNTNKRMKKYVYLLPGQEFIYGGEMTAKVKAFKIKNAAPEQIMNAELVWDNPSLPENVETPFFMFNNQPLGQVLRDLAALYNVKIIYDKDDVNKIYFTGKYDRSEPVERILGRIGTLNNLTITKKDSAYIISK